MAKHPQLSRILRLAVLLSTTAVALSFLAPLLIAQEPGWAERDVWQRPVEVMDALGAKSGSVVADIGAGPGYFTFRLAERVGPQGRVYAEDILKDRLDSISERAAKEHRAQITTILGTPDDPRLPIASLDAALIVNAYHEFRDYDAMLQGVFHALKPGGRLAVIDCPADPGQPRESYYARHHIPEDFVRGDLTHNGFHVVREYPGFSDPDSGRTYFFLLYEKPKAP